MSGERQCNFFVSKRSIVGYISSQQLYLGENTLNNAQIALLDMSRARDSSRLTNRFLTIGINKLEELKNRLSNIPRKTSRSIKQPVKHSSTIFLPISASLPELLLRRTLTTTASRCLATMKIITSLILLMPFWSSQHIWVQCRLKPQDYRSDSRGKGSKALMAQQ